MIIITVGCAFRTIKDGALKEISRQPSCSWYSDCFFFYTERFLLVRRSVWPLDFASASRTTTRRSARVSHTMSAAANHRAMTLSSYRNRITTSRTVEIIPKNQLRATTCHRMRSLPGTRWAPPQVRLNPAIQITCFFFKRQWRYIGCEKGGNLPSTCPPSTDTLSSSETTSFCTHRNVYNFKHV